MNKANKNVAVLAFAMDCIRDAAFLVDERAKIHYVNEEACRSYGYTRDELLGMTVADIDPDYQLDRWPNHWADLKSHRTLIFESRHITKDGIIFPVELSANYFEYEGESYNLGLARDITERKKAEKTLRESEERFRKIFEDGPLGMTIVGLDFRYKRANSRMCQLVGYSEEELTSKSVDDITYRDDIGKDTEQANQLLRSQISRFSTEKRYVRKRGEIVWVNLTVSLLRSETGEPLYFIAMVEDITERKKLEDALRKSHSELEVRVIERTAELQVAHEELQKSERKLKDIIDFLPDATLAIDSEKKITIWNKAIEKMTGVKAEDILGKGNYEYTIAFYGERLSQLMDLIWEKNQNIIEKYDGVICDGNCLSAEVFCGALYNGRGAYVFAKVSPIHDQKGNIVGAIESIRDITEFKLAQEKVSNAWADSEARVMERTAELSVANASLKAEVEARKKIEEALKRSHEELELRVQERTSELKMAHDRLRSLTAHLQSVREEERTNIAREIHDELGQALTAQKMELSWFREKYGDHELIYNKASAMLDALNSTIQSVRRICTELRPSILDDFGLAEAMKWQAHEFQTRTRIECVVDSVPEDIELDKGQSTALFRIFQEALTNVLKHSRAKKVIARLTKDNDNVTLEVIDNGRGITDAQLSKPQSFGLIGMRERVYPWGGKVKITGHKNKGTSVKVILPLSQAYNRQANS